MIKTGKVDLLINYLSYALKLSSNFIVLPIILSKLSSAEYGLWVLFLAFGALTILLDMGFGTVIVRYITYAYCGAKELPKKGLPDINTKEEPNYKLLFTVFLTSKKIYRNISLIAFGVLFLITFYIIYVSKGTTDVSTVLSSWVIYSSGILLSIYFLYYTSIYKGLGKIKELEIINIINQLVYIILLIILLTSNLGLLALAVSNFIVSILLRYQLSVSFNKIIKENRNDFLAAKNEMINNFKPIYESIVYNSKGIGGILVSNFIQNQGITLLCSAFFSLKVVGMYGLTVQLVGIIGTLSSVPFKTFLAKMSYYQLALKEEKLKDTYSFGTIVAFVIFFVGGSILLLFGNYALSILDSNTSLLPQLQLVVLLLYNFILMNHQRSTAFIQIGNIQPYVSSYIISSILSLVISALLLLWRSDIWMLILTNLLVQSIYNGWKWPYEAMKISNVKLFEMIKRTIKVLKEQRLITRIMK